MSSNAHYLCPRWASSILLRRGEFLSFLHCPTRHGKRVWKESNPIDYWQRHSAGKRKQWSPLRGFCRFFPWPFNAKCLNRCGSRGQNFMDYKHLTCSLLESGLPFLRDNKCWSSVSCKFKYQSADYGITCIIKWLSFGEKGAGMYLEIEGFLSFTKVPDLNGILSEKKNCKNAGEAVVCQFYLVLCTWN